MTYGDILVPTDGSGGVQESVSAAVELAERAGATVHALYVVDTRIGKRFADAVWPGKELRVEGEKAVASIEGAAHRADLDAETAVRRGVPAEEILDYADEHGIDLVVMGTHGRSGPERAVVGSTTEHVLRSADVPVLVVRANEH